ncbi:hypothetical protein L195_g040711, partial [Trifolium pratense]
MHVRVGPLVSVYGRFRPECVPRQLIFNCRPSKQSWNCVGINNVSAHKCVDNNPLLGFVDSNTLQTIVDRENGDDVAMTTAPERQNDIDLNHSASEEVLAEELMQVHTDTTQNNARIMDSDMPELIPDSVEEVVAETQIILQKPALPQVVLDDMEKIKQTWENRTSTNTKEEVSFTS